MSDLLIPTIIKCPEYTLLYFCDVVPPCVIQHRFCDKYYICLRLTATFRIVNTMFTSGEWHTYFEVKDANVFAMPSFCFMQLSGQ